MKLSAEFEGATVYVETIVKRLFLKAAEFRDDDNLLTSERDALCEALERIGWDLGEEYGLSARRIGYLAKECGL